MQISASARRLPLILKLLACTAGAALVLAAPASAAGFEWESVVAQGVEPAGLATDAAGRLYVADPVAHVVRVYDSVRGSNKPLAPIGTGALDQPVSVTIDDRHNVYVADKSRNLIALFGPYSTGAKLLGVTGRPGGALTEFDGLRQIAIDPEPRLYATEAGNLRVQVLDPAKDELRKLFAFGVSEPAPFAQPDGVAVDSSGRVFVADNEAGGTVRTYDAHGFLQQTAVGPGTGSGLVNAPRGVTIDRFDRLLVADTGNDRVQAFGSAAAGFAGLGAFGTAGSGVGNFNDPAYLALAPGALLYVSDAGNDRVVRLRYDDADHDGAVDAGDVCPGVPDPQQRDNDGDRAGNACDSDDDNDGLPDAVDPCPVTPVGDDGNRDGCRDPVSRARAPFAGTQFRGVKKPRSIAGTARGDRVGIKHVEVAVVRIRGSHCRWLDTRRHRFVAGSCFGPRFNRASGTRNWRLAVPASQLGPGRYRILTRAAQKVTGAVESRASTRSRARYFSVPSQP